jgi:N,N'-diacetyllegionaminate synthase
MENLIIKGRLVGPGQNPYIIAEIGSNHNGDIDLCKKIIDAAKTCGADAVKLQSWNKESLISKAEYARNTSYSDKKKHFGSLEEMVEKYQLTPEQHEEISKYCNGKKITFISSAFSDDEVDLLVSLNVPVFKIASMDINNLPLLRYIACKHKPVIVSTGMATLGEIEQALAVLKTSGSGPIALLHCISIYPPVCNNINLRNIPMLQQVFDMPVGFSDHSLGASIPLAAVALNACIIEKHFTLDKNLEGWDHAISADPSELSYLVNESRTIFNSLGSSTRIVHEDEVEKRKKFRRRAVAKYAMKKGYIITEDSLAFKRPGNGINPDEIKYVIGRAINKNVEQDHEIEWSDLS